MCDCFRALLDLLCKIWRTEATSILRRKASTFTRWNPNSTRDVQIKLLSEMPLWYRTLESLETHHLITRNKMNKSEVPIYQVWMHHLPAVPVVVVFLVALASSVPQAGRRCAQLVSAESAFIKLDFIHPNRCLTFQLVFVTISISQCQNCSVFGWFLVQDASASDMQR